MVVLITTIFFIINQASAIEKLTGQHGLWIVRHNLKTKASVDKVIADIVKLNIKHAYVQVRGRGYAYYNSAIEPKAPEIEPFFDPLQYFIEQASQKNIQVYAWINIYLLWTSPKDPSNQSHLFYKHPDWFDTIRQTPSDLSFRHIYLSPMCMKANLYLLAIIEEIIDQYRIDGIHLDYIRYFNELSGYHLAGIEEFSLKNGGINSDFTKSEEWIEYKTQKIDDLVADISDLVKIQSRPLVLSAAVKPNPVQAYYEYGQNWKKWLDMGWMNYVVLMNYAENVENFTENLSRVQKQCEPSKVYCGIGLWNKPLAIIQQQIDQSKAFGFYNLVLFSYDSFVENNWLK
ncbi:MAG: family 10 glycosylhydrolase [Candidatus Marinimicrobia bacterium]|nr:family 10 glycosylhydrolase [Candidatus Neomarinimicrobiota bacterium]